MNSRINRSEGAGESGDHIWLRYGTQFTLNGRTHTIEMTIPMPIGADEEMREQLLREADAGMGQLSEHVENRVAQMLQRAQPNQGKLPTPTPLARSSPQTRPASIPAQQTGPQPLQAARPYESQQAEPLAPVARTREKEPEAAPAQEAVAATPITRSDIGASMPSIPPGESGGNLSLQQFIGYIRENMGLSPKQAMDILKIKSLSGVNLREALEHLQKHQEGATPTGTPAKAQESTPPARPASSPAPVRNTPPASPPTLSSLRSPAREVERGGRGDLNEHSPAYRPAFDEEIDPHEEEDDLEDLDDLDLPRELSAQERVQARKKIDSMRETRGATVTNSARLQVLSNVTSTQISQEQMRELIEGIWGIDTIKKLKVDQAEMLISWAKEDDFVSEVEAVLTMLEEE
ncbi:MAG TPA: hypothetical protein VGU68_00740 [Ktedonobacteraceae bacterium]|nr:hypothetical protein [Ktedonobacteraceae bacterium]